MKRLIQTILIVGIIPLAAFCGGAEKLQPPEPPGPDPETNRPRALVHYTSCDELLADLQNNLIKEMEEDLESYGTCVLYDTGDMMGDPAPASDGTGAEEAPEVTFTDTNLQEAGVDEPDVIKTNGEYTFVATSEGIDIFKTSPASEFRKVTTLEASGSSRRLFLHNNRLVVLSQDYEGESYSSFARIIVIDIANPEEPVALEERTIDGIVGEGRIVDGTLHVVVNGAMRQPATDYPEIDWELWDDSCDEGAKGEAARNEIEKKIESVKASNREKILASMVADWLPRVGDGQTSRTVDCSAVARDSSSSLSLVGLFSLSLDTEQSREQVTFVKGWAYDVYASTESVYLTSTEWSTGETEEETTLLHRFQIGSSPNLHDYVASGSVPGSIVNSFALGEYDGHLRIATTSGWWDDAANALFVLDSSKADLPVVGKIEGLAKGESIYAVRFVGKRGYVVTFKKVDPLFVINLSDPANPVLQGELEMPGFSTYLHPLGDDHLIGLGRDAEDMGEFAWFQGLKLALFDVSGDNPTIVDELLIGSRGSDSEALGDHHAFTFDAASGILALPLSLYEGASGGSDYGEFAYSGVHLYKISAADGIETVAKIPLGETEWNAPSRTVMVGDDEGKGLYSLDSSALTLIAMDDPYQVLDRIELSGSEMETEPWIE